MIDVASRRARVPAMSMVNGRPVAAEARLPVRIPEGALRDMLLLASIWVASLFVVNPLGDFPLNDDWSFGLAVKHLLQTGDFRPTGFTSMPLVTQTLWGALFCLPGGFSFNALRFSTLVLSLCSLLVVYLLVRRVHPSRLLAAIAALTVAFNPIYFALSNTFMTDVPFTALLLAAAFFFSRCLQSGSDFDLLCGLACALAATLCRQLGVGGAHGLCGLPALESRIGGPMGDSRPRPPGGLPRSPARLPTLAQSNWTAANSLFASEWGVSLGALHAETVGAGSGKTHRDCAALPGLVLAPGDDARLAGGRSSSAEGAAGL